MPNSDMPPIDEHHAYYKALMILIAGGPPRHGEMERWLEKIHLRTGPTPKERVGVRSLLAIWRGDWISKNQFVSRKTHHRLEEAAENARKTKDLVEYIELQIAIWETRPDLYQQDIAEAREYLSRMRRVRSRLAETGDAAPAIGFAAAVKA